MPAGLSAGKAEYGIIRSAKHEDEHCIFLDAVVHLCYR